MSTDELARAYIAKIERQQRAQSTVPFGLIQDASGRASLAGSGLLSMDGQSVCPRCHACPARLWLQFISLGLVGILTAYNYAFILTFLPARVPQEKLARAWLDASELAWLYGWIVLGVFLLGWTYYWWKRYGYSPEPAVRVGIGFLTVLLLAAFAQSILPWIPRVRAQLLRTWLDSHPELATIAAWGMLGLALISICCNCESRDRLLGTGKSLSLLSLTFLCMMLALTWLTVR